MTTSTIDRALLEQALEALEACYSPEYYGAKIYAAKLALRAELAKQKLDPVGSELLSKQADQPELTSQGQVCAALAAPDDIAAEMSTVADQYAHKLALDLECVLSDYSGTWYDAAMTTLGAYREAMNAIHERESPTFMGEPVIRPAQAAPAPDDRHRQELLAMEITLQNMEARHAEELAAYELTVANLRAELAKPVEGAKPVAWMDDFGNAFPIGARKGAGSWMDAHQRNWKPLYLHPPTPAWHDAPEVAALKAERDAAMKDAERYRYLRDMTPWTAISAFDKTRVAFRLASKLSEEAQDSGVDLDKAIDAAIAKAEGGAA